MKIVDLTFQAFQFLRVIPVLRITVGFRVGQGLLLFFPLPDKGR